MENITRRDFLKISGAGVVVGSMFSFKRYLNEIFKPTYEMPVEFHIDNHIVSPSIIDPKTKVIMGESNIEEVHIRRFYIPTEHDKKVLQESPTQSAIDRTKYEIVNNGVGLSEDETSVNNATLASLRKNEIELVATDRPYPNTVSGDVLETYNKERDKVGSTVLVADAATLLTTSVAGFFLTRRFAWKIFEELTEENKKHLAQSLGIGAAAITFSAILNLVVQNDSNLYSIFSRDYLQKSISELTVNNRNLNMAHNMRLTEILLQQNWRLTKRLNLDNSSEGHVTAFAGDAHMKLPSDYGLGERELSQEIKIQIHSDVNDALAMLKRIDAGVVKDTKEQDFLNLWTNVVCCYNFPVASFYEHDEYTQPDKYYLPPTARLLLWQDLRLRLLDDENKPYVTKLMARLTEEDLTFFDSNARKFPEVNAMVERMQRLKKMGKTYTIPLYSILGNENPGNKPVIIVSEGIPFVMEEKDLV